MPVFSRLSFAAFFLVCNVGAYAGIIQPPPADSAIDTSFAPGSDTPGWQRLKVTLGDDRAIGFGRMPDGHYITALAVPGGSAGPRLVLFRRGADGTANGDVTHDPGFTSIAAMTVDALGRTIVVGKAPGPGGLGDLRVVRIDAEGALDTTFSSDGIATFGFDGEVACDDVPSAVLAQADGRVVVVGSAQFPGFPSRFSVLRVNEDGSLDTTFGSNSNGAGGFRGTTDMFVDGDAAYGADVLEMAGGHLLVVGTSVWSDLDTDFAARILTPAGQPWSGFTGSMSFPIDEPGPGGSLYDNAVAGVKIDHRTALLVGNASGHAAVRRIRLGPPNSMGQYTTLEVDTTFVGSEIAVRPYRYVSDAQYHVNDAAVRADGTIMLVGRQASFEGATFVLVERLLHDGRRDDDFASAAEYATYAAPTTALGDSYSTEFVGVLIDSSRPVLLGTAADDSSAATDLDAVLTRLASSQVTPLPLFADGFEPVEISD